MKWLVVALLTLVVGTLAKVNVYTVTAPWTYVCDSSNSSIGGHYVGARWLFILFSHMENIILIGVQQFNNYDLSVFRLYDRFIIDLRNKVA